MGYIPALEEILHEIHVTNLPKPSDYDNRKDLVRVFNEIAKEIYGKIHNKLQRMSTQPMYSQSRAKGTNRKNYVELAQ
ncbi:unnamed protein product [Ilex paraguariensis]|uniref:Uncharacterized protein n=1 Tax=Ilex paraguariensis TaxID=185542 RepID=A0ABC8UK67_9AQUA